VIAGGFHQSGTGVVTWDMSTTDRVVDPDRVEEAAAAIPGEFTSTPQYRSDGLSALLGLDVFLKVETVNPAGSAAGRSAEWWFECHPEAHRIVCPSAGDFGLAMAHAGRSRGVEVDLFGPLSADRLKVDDMRRCGIAVQLDGQNSMEATAEARRYASVVDAQFIDDGPHVEFLEGSATIAAELTADLVEAGAMFVPAEMAFLPVGVGQWLHQLSPHTRVVAVAVGSAPASVGVGNPSIDQTVHVRSEVIREAQQALTRHEGLNVSPSGAAPLAAAALAGPTIRGSKVVVVIGSRGLD